MKKNDMMLWLSKGVTAEEALKLSNAGFTPDTLDDSKEPEDEKPEDEKPEEEEPVKPKTNPKEPEEEEPVKPKTDPKDFEIEKLQKQIAELQKLNRHQDFSGEEKAKTDLEIAKDIAAKLF